MQSIGLDALPLWGLFVLILLVVLLSVECGYRLGKYRRSRNEQEKGYLEGLAGTRRSLAIIAVAVAFSVVIELIADLDRPQEGILRVSQEGPS